MNRVKHIAKLFGDPTFLRKFHGWTTIVWMFLLIPSIIFWSESVLWVILLSVWANIASHWAAWQASRGEVKQDENNNGNGKENKN